MKQLFISIALLVLFVGQVSAAEAENKWHVGNDGRVFKLADSTDAYGAIITAKLNDEGRIDVTFGIDIDYCPSGKDGELIFENDIYINNIKYNTSSKCQDGMVYIIPFGRARHEVIKCLYTSYFLTLKVNKNKSGTTFYVKDFKDINLSNPNVN